MSESTKNTVYGLLTVTAMAIVSAFILPLYLLPAGYVWLIALGLVRVRFGRVPAYAGAVMLGFSAYLFLGGAGALFAGTTAVISVAALDVALRPQGRLTQGVLYVFFAMLVCVLGGALYVFLAYGDVVSAIMAVVNESLAQAGDITQAYIDSLNELYQVNVTQQELLSSMEDQLRLSLPSYVILYSIYGASFTVLFSLKFARRTGRGDDFMTGADLLRWSLPKYTGRTLAGAALVCYLIASMGLYALQSAAYTIWQLLYALFVLQGILALSFSMRMRGVKPVWRYVLITLLFLIFKPALFVFGVFDRFSPIRRKLSLSVMGKDGKIVRFGIDESPKDEHDGHDDDGHDGEDSK